MPPAKGGRTPAGGKKSAAKKEPPKRMGSLSSFQPTLSFARVPSSSTNTNSKAGPSTAARSRSSTPSMDDSMRMPPPPVPSRSTTAARSSAAPPAKRGKGKGRADEVIEIIDSDEDDSPRKRRSLATTTANAMWTDLYAPESESELAPGKARVAKVREWLHEAVYGIPEAVAASGHRPNETTRDRLRKYKRVLLVTGPAGIGKTTTVRLLAEQLGVELAEWTESVEERSLGGGFEHESAMSKLTAFLSRNAYPTLNMSVGSSSQHTAPPPRALLMTSLPNISHRPTRDAFHETLLAFCKSYNSASCPLIIVHSDSGSGGRAEESWMGRDRGGLETIFDVVGREVKDGPWCAEIDFLPLAPTFVIKAINRVLNLAISDAAKRPSTGAVQLIAQSSRGDLRSAINSLQLLCTGNSVKSSKKRRTDGARPKATGRGSRGGRGAKIDVSDEIRAALDAVTRREQSLNLFHALGKVFYNKRLGDPSTENDDLEEIDAVRRLPDTDSLPPHMRDFERNKSMVQMEAFIPTIPVDASTFALWIHQNVPQFCSEIEELSALLDDFCAADLMRTDDDIWQSSPQAIAYALHLTVRGSLMALPSPVPRLGQKVTKPQFFESYRLERDNASLLDVAAGYMAKKAVASSVALANGTPGGNLVWGGIASKSVLAMETVPMAIKVQSLSRRPLLPISVQPLALAPYRAGQTTNGGIEITSRDTVEDEPSFEAEAAGEDGMGVPDSYGWDADDPMEGKEDEVGWLEDDDIEDFDDE